MKKLLLIVVLLLASVSAKADEIAVNFGPVNLLVPFSSVDAVYQYDAVGKTSLVGAETPILSVWKLRFTGGAVTSIDGEGTPFIGANLAISNPAENYVPLVDVKPGLFVGRNFRTNEWIAGLKASINIFE